MGQQGSERGAQATASGKDGLKGQEEGYSGDVYLGCACRGRAQRQSSDIWKNQPESEADIKNKHRCGRANGPLVEGPTIYL